MFELIKTLIDARRAKLDERGASAVEYGLLIAGIAAMIIAVFFVFGGTIRDVFSDTCGTIQSGGTGTGGC